MSNNPKHKCLLLFYWHPQLTFTICFIIFTAFEFIGGCITINGVRNGYG